MTIAFWYTPKYHGCIILSTLHEIRAQSRRRLVFVLNAAPLVLKLGFPPATI
jgi:hypothetical protein